MSDCSSLPCSPKSDASFWNESQMHNVIDQAGQTPESASTSATSPLHQHSAGGSEALQLGGPTLGQDEAARSSVRINEPIRVPSSGSKGYWTNANAALEAVIEQSCPGLRSSPPEQALRQLSAVTYNFFSQPVPPHRSGPTRPATNFEQHHSSDPSQEAPQPPSGIGDSAPANQPLRLLHYAMISIRPTSKSNGSPDSTRHSPRLADKQWNTKSVATPKFPLEQAEMFFSNQFANEDGGYCYARYQDLPDPPPKTFTLSSSPPTFSELQKALHSGRNGAVPGPNGIPNTIWKRCSCLHAPLFDIIQ